MIDLIFDSGYALSESIHPWWIWGYWLSPLSYAQNAIAVNEFLAPRWKKVRVLIFLFFCRLYSAYINCLYQKHLHSISNTQHLKTTLSSFNGILLYFLMNFWDFTIMKNSM